MAILYHINFCQNKKVLGSRLKNMFHECKKHTKLIIFLQKEFKPTLHYNCTILYYILLDQGHKKLPLNSDHHCNKVHTCAVIICYLYFFNPLIEVHFFLFNEMCLENYVLMQGCIPRSHLNFQISLPYLHQGRQILLNIAEVTSKFFLRLRPCFV